MILIIIMPWVLCSLFSKLSTFLNTPQVTCDKRYVITCNNIKNSGKVPDHILKNLDTKATPEITLQ